jgi:rfaE bifunctional protein nucleotidyltransferase chain/domain
MNAKIQSRAQLVRTLSRLHRQQKRIVFTNGCFDLLHVGHVTAFEKAKALGDVLVVGITSDASLKRLKGPKRPLVNEKDRARVLAALEAIDYITVFGEDTPYELVKALRPDILVKGGDYRLEDIVGRELVKKVARIPLVKGKSTTALIKKIVDSYGK